MLIVETADMLQAPLFTAEALLRAHGTCFYVKKKMAALFHHKKVITIFHSALLMTCIIYSFVRLGQGKASGSLDVRR